METKFCITLIDNPPYIVDFKDIKPEVKEQVVQSFLEKVKFIALAAIESVAMSAYLTLRHSGTSFKIVVLGMYGPIIRIPSNLHLAAFKVAFWMAGLGWGFITTASRLFMNKVNPETTWQLNLFASSAINVDHIRTDESELDVSGVPDNVKVSDLAGIFKEINFNDPAKPGYFPPSTRVEEGSEISIEKLSKALDLFITRINTREPFVGTPPSYDMPRLLSYYQQLENGVRLSLHKVNQDLEKFYALNGKDVSLYDEKQMNAYKDALSERSRLALDFAITASNHHCGTRYMGDVMSTYYYHYKESLRSGATLQESIIEVLAHKRKEIALMQIAIHFSGNGQSSHGYNQYMSNLGTLLGIPGTKNITEHFLDGTMDRNAMIKEFFTLYTVDAIIEAVNDSLKTSQPLRAKLDDWIKDQVKEWNKEKYQVLEDEYVPLIETLMKSEEKESVFTAYFDDLLDLLAYLKEKNVELPAWKKSWNGYLEELCGLDQTKEWRQIRFPGLDMFKELMKMNELKGALSENKLGAELIDQLKNYIQAGTELNVSDFHEKSIELNRIKEIRKIVPINEDTIRRILKGEVNLKEAVKDQLDLQRREEFFERFELYEIEKQGVSKELLEWLLVPGILLPQGEI